MQAPKDGDKQPLNGAKKFIITFPTDALPPVGGFWSVSMSDSSDFFVENPLNRNAIGNRAGLMEAEPEHRAGTDAARLMRRLMALTHSA